MCECGKCQIASQKNCYPKSLINVITAGEQLKITSEIKEFLVEAEIVEKQPTIQLYNKEAETYELPQKSYTLNKHI